MDATHKATRRAQSARALLWAAAIAALLGTVTPSPAGTLFMLAVATAFAAVAATLGRGRLRMVAGAIALLLAALAVAAYPAYRDHVDAYLERAVERPR